MKTNTFLLELNNALQDAQRGGTSKEDIRQDLDVFLHQLVGDGSLPAPQVAGLLKHAREVMPSNVQAVVRWEKLSTMSNSMANAAEPGATGRFQARYECPACGKEVVLDEILYRTGKDWLKDGRDCPHCGYHASLTDPTAAKA